MTGDDRLRRTERHRHPQLEPGFRPEAVARRRRLPVGRSPDFVGEQRVGAFTAVEQVHTEASGGRELDRSDRDVQRHLPTHFEVARQGIGDPAVHLPLRDRVGGRFVVAARGRITSQLDAARRFRRRLQRVVARVVVFGRLRGIFGGAVGRRSQQQRIGRSRDGSGLGTAGADAEGVVKRMAARDFRSRGGSGGRAWRIGEEELLRGDDSVGSGDRVAAGAVFGIDEVRLNFDVGPFTRLVGGFVQPDRDDDLFVVLGARTGRFRATGVVAPDDVAIDATADVTAGERRRSRFDDAACDEAAAVEAAAVENEIGRVAAGRPGHRVGRPGDPVVGVQRIRGWRGRRGRFECQLFVREAAQGLHFLLGTVKRDLASLGPLGVQRRRPQQAEGRE